MPPNLSLYLLLILAIGAGFILGRRDKLKRDRNPQLIPKPFLSGLNFLLNEKIDKAVEIFTRTIAVSDETLDTHLALGNRVRRQGEIDRAIRIHESLLARSGLSKKKCASIEIELARDYLSAGLLDRAEQLLRDLARNSTRFEHTARLLLLDIYERESEWQAAIGTANELLKKKLFGRDGLGDDSTARCRLKIALAHYYCELAECSMKSPDYEQTRELLDQASQVDLNNARVSLALADLAIEQQQFGSAKISLERVGQQNSSLIPETLARYHSVCCNLELEDEYYNYLKNCLEKTVHIDVLIEYARLMRLRTSAEEVRKFILKQINSQPSIAVVRLWLEMFDEHADKQSLDVWAIKQSLGPENPTQIFRCKNCGFSLKQLLWFCPSCKLWGEISRVP